MQTNRSIGILREEMHTSIQETAGAVAEMRNLLAGLVELNKTEGLLHRAPMGEIVERTSVTNLEEGCMEEGIQLMLEKHQEALWQKLMQELVERTSQAVRQDQLQLMFEGSEERLRNTLSDELVERTSQAVCQDQLRLMFDRIEVLSTRLA